MSDAGAVAPSEGAGAPTELTDAQAIEAFEGLLDERPRRRERQPPSAAEGSGDEPSLGEAPDDAGSDDDDVVPSDEEEGQEPEAEEDSDPSAIKPPDSWSAKEKAEIFAQLPPEAQEVIARRESEQNAAFTRKTQELAEHRHAIEATLGEIQNERARYAENIEQLLFVAAPEVQQYQNINWQLLAQERPDEYVRLSAQRDALRGRIGGMQQELARVREQSQMAAAQQFAQLRQSEAMALVEKIPEFADPQKGPAKANAMRGWLRQRGFNDQEISQVVDHRVLLVVDEAMQADRVQQARRQAESKRSNSAPAVQPPGSGRQRPDSRAAQQRAVKMDRLRKSGSPDDAISLLMDIL